MPTNSPTPAPTGDLPSVAPDPAPSTGSRLAAEGFGTFLLVFATVGTALFASHLANPDALPAGGIVGLSVAIVVGLTVIVGVYAFGPISGGHFNPAVTLGLAAAGRFEWRAVGGYIFAQVTGALIATTALVLIGIFGPDGWIPAAQEGARFASNGWGALSPGGFGMGAAIIVEIICTALFVTVILGVTHPRRGTPFAGLAIGLTLTLFHLATIPVDNTSLNPARSIASAVYGGVEALGMLWVFLVFPIVGGILAGLCYRALFDNVRLPAA